MNNIVVMNERTHYFPCDIEAVMNYVCVTSYDS